MKNYQKLPDEKKKIIAALLAMLVVMLIAAAFPIFFTIKGEMSQYDKQIIVLEK